MQTTQIKTSTKVGSSSGNVGSTSGGSGSTSVSTKQVHPAILSTFAPTGCELSTWAFLTLPRPRESNSKWNGANSQELPNLVTAHSNSLKIHVVDPMSGTLVLASSYDNLAGTITTLHALPNAAGTISGRNYDGLLIGFAGQPRMSIVYPPGGLLDELSSSSSGCWSGVLTASSIIDLTPPLIERSFGSVSPLEQDLSCCITQDKKVPTVAVVLGGGVSIAAFHLQKSNYDGAGRDASSTCEKSSQNWWRTASDPYFLPLSKLASTVPMSRATATSALYQKYQSRSSQTATGQNVSKFSHGFGDILSCAFLSGYTEPVLVILHSNPHRYGGRSCPGRLGHRSSYTRTPLCLTAISISIAQRRSVVLWSLPDAMPSDAFECHSHPKGGVMVVGVNEVLYVDCAGKIKCCTAVNGWVRSTGSAALLPKLGSFRGIMQPNPSPLPKLSIQLDGCRLSFVNENVAMLALRDGTLYTMELHNENECVGAGGDDTMCISLSPVGKKIGGLGMISTLSALPLLKIQAIGVDFGKFLDESSLNPKKEEAANETLESSGPISGKHAKTVWKDDVSSSLGLVFAGSRMGDSSLLLYGLKDKVTLIPLERDVDDEEQSSNEIKRKRENESSSQSQVKKEKLEFDGTGPNNIEAKEQKVGTDITTVTDDEGNLSLEDMLRLEEEALYGLDSDEDMNAFHSQQRNSTLLPGITPKQLYRPQIRAMSVFQHTKVLDSLTGLGPIGPGCTGPTAGRESKDAVSMFRHLLRTPSKGSVVNVHPCGYGSSGGLVILSKSGMHPGLTVESEIDCLDIGAIFPCPHMGYFFVQKKGPNSGCIVMRVSKEDNLTALEEISIDSVVEEIMDAENSIPSFQNVRDVLTRMNILSVKEFQLRDDLSTRCVIVTRFGSAYGIVIFSLRQGKFVIDHSHIIGSLDGGQMIDRDCLVSVSFVENLDASKLPLSAEDVSFACVWSSGNASIFNISKQVVWTVKEFIVSRDVMKRKDINKSGFHYDGRITAIDIFAIADSIFDNNSQNTDTNGENEEDVLANSSSEGFKFDEDDFELYVDGDDNFLSNYPNRIHRMEAGKSMESSEMAPSRYNSLAGYISGAGLSKRNKSVLAITRRSGQLDIYDLSKILSLSDSMVQLFSYEELHPRALLWNTIGGCGHGAPILNRSSMYSRYPLSQETYSAEIRFFFCGPSESAKPDDTRDLSLLRSLCLLVETNQGDTQLYTATKSNANGDISFKRVPLHLVSRPSRDEKRHRDKLSRKGIAKIADESGAKYRNNRLHRFFSISGEDGLFAATSRPMWFLSERGAPSVVYHRLRHCAPAGGADVPVAGFCSGFSLDSQETQSGFITVHERIGRVGSQRLTLFNG
jgi:cleavage and polyadenylation specificity factor subunit 1